MLALRLCHGEAPAARREAREHAEIAARLTPADAMAHVAVATVLDLTIRTTSSITAHPRGVPFEGSGHGSCARFDQMGSLPINLIRWDPYTLTLTRWDIAID